VVVEDLREGAQQVHYSLESFRILVDVRTLEL
jgi:hypothetical protein